MSSHRFRVRTGFTVKAIAKGTARMSTFMLKMSTLTIFALPVSPDPS